MIHRYFNPNLPKTLGEILKILAVDYTLSFNGADLSSKILKISSLNAATGGEISFFGDPKYLDAYNATRASFIITSHGIDLPSNSKDSVLIQVSNPMHAYVNLLNGIYEDADYYDFIGLEGFSKEHASQMRTVSNSAEIGEGTILSPQCFIGRGVKIGKNCFIGPNVSITHAEIGNGCIIHAGSSIGQDGFSCFRHGEVMVKIKQVGGIRIGDNVEFGSNCTIARGSISDTVIGSHCALDDQVHIAHNVVLGDGAIIAGQSAIAGSSRLGKNITMGGQSGIVGHVTVGDEVTIAARSGLIKTIPSKKIVAGYPAIDINLWRKSCVILRKLAKK